MQGFNLLHLSLLGWFPLLCLFWLPLFASLFSVKFLPLTRGVEGGHLFRLTCSVVLRRGSDSANKYCWHMWLVLAVDGPYWDCHGPRWRVLSGSILLRIQGAPQGHCPEWTQGLVHFSVLSFLGSPVLRKSADPGGLCVLCPSQVQGLRWLDAWRAHSPRWAVHLIHPPGPRHSVSWVYHVSPLGSWSQAVTVLAYVNHPGSQEDVISNWQPAYGVVEDAVPGSEIAAAPCLPLLAIAHLLLCLWGGRAPNGSQLLLFWYLIGHKTLFCVRTRGHRLALERFAGEVLLFIYLFICLSGNPTVWVAMSH